MSNNQLAMQGYQTSGAPGMNGQVTVQGVNDQATKTYVDSKGVLQSVNTAMPVKPQLTGNVLLDQKLVAGYKSAVTARDSGIVKLYQAGQISSSQAESMLSSGAAASGKGRKPLKIAIKHTAVKKVKLAKSKKIKIKVPKLKAISLTPFKVKVKKNVKTNV
jgi:hypothetical protein